MEGKRDLPSVRSLLGNFAISANTIDLLTIFRDRLILNYAKNNDYHFVLKGLNTEALASQSFNFFAKGLGGNLPLLCTTDSNTGPFHFPLRNHSRK